MSEVIRDVTIRLKLEQQKAKLESPEISKVTQAYNEQAKAAKEIQSQTANYHRQLDESAKVVVNSNYRMLASFREGGEGALRMARGIAFLSANGSSDIQKLARVVATAQGAFDVFAGGFKAVSNLTAAMGPLGVAVTGVTAAVTVGGLAWAKWKGDAEAARKKAEEFRNELLRVNEAIRHVATAAQDRRLAQMGRRAESVIVEGTEEDKRLAAETARATMREELGVFGRALEKEYASKNPQFAADFYGARKVVGTRMRGSEYGPGDEERLRSALDYEQRRADLTRKQYELDRTQFELDRTRAREKTQQSQFLEAGSAVFGIGSAFGVLGGTAIAGGITSSSQQNLALLTALVEKQNSVLQKLLSQLDEFENRVSTLQIDLGAANPR